MKILIIRRDNIGDLICTTPLFEALRRHYPDAYLAALVNSYNEPAIRGNPYLDAIFAYTKGKHAVGEAAWQAHLRRVRIVWKLRRMKFDYVIMTAGGLDARSLKLARMLAPRHIIGFNTDKLVVGKNRSCRRRMATAAACTRPRMSSGFWRRSAFRAKFPG